MFWLNISPAQPLRMNRKEIVFLYDMHFVSQVSSQLMCVPVKIWVSTSDSALTSRCYRSHCCDTIAPWLLLLPSVSPSAPPPPLLPAQDFVCGVCQNLQGLSFCHLLCFTSWHLTVRHQYPHKSTIPRRWKARRDNSLFHSLTTVDLCFTFHPLVSCCLRVFLQFFICCFLNSFWFCAVSLFFLQYLSLLSQEAPCRHAVRWYCQDHKLP